MGTIQQRMTETYVISGAKNLDPVTVYVTNYAPGKGKLVIECDCEAWAYYWGAMGDRNLQQFVLQANNHYLAGKLSRTHHQTDFDAINDEARKFGIELGVISDVEVTMARDTMTEIYGSDWHMDLPQCYTSEYQHVCKILDAVKEAFITSLSPNED